MTLDRWCRALDIPWDPAWQSGLETHLALLKQWAPKVNLISLKSGEDPAIRHTLDSLTLLKLAAVRDLEPGTAAADLGAGAGFPGIPLAIARPDTHWTLIEPRTKRGAFLTQVIARAALTNAHWTETRTPDPALNGQFDLVVSRATLEPTTLLTHAAPLLKPEGRVCVMAAAPPPTPPGWTRLETVELELAGAPRVLASFAVG